MGSELWGIATLLSLALMPGVSTDSIAVARSADSRRAQQLLFLFLFGEEDVLGEVAGSRISPTCLEVLLLQVRHNVGYRGQLLRRDCELRWARSHLAALLLLGHVRWRISGPRRPPRRLHAIGSH